MAIATSGVGGGVLSTEEAAAVRLGRVLQRARQTAGLSVRQAEAALADRYGREGGISQAHLYRMESGQIGSPTFTDLLKLAQLYQIPFGDMVAAVGFGRPEDGEEELSETKRAFRAAADVFVRRGTDEQVEYALTLLRMMLSHHGLGS